MIVMKKADTFAEYVLNNKAYNVVKDVQRTLGSVYGVTVLHGLTERQLLSYAKAARLLLDDELAVCQAVYGQF